MGFIFWEEFLILWRFKLKLWCFFEKKFGTLSDLELRTVGNGNFK